MSLAKTPDTTTAGAARAIPTRRTLFGGAAAVVIGSGITAGAAASVADLVPAEPDANLVALCDEYVDRLRRERSALETMTEQHRRAFYHAATASAIKGQDQWDDRMVRRIAAVPAHSPAGQAAKARALVWYYGGSDDHDPFGWRSEDALLASLVADVAGRA